MLESLYNKVLRETPTQVISCEYCEIFKKIDFEEHLRMAASSDSRTLVNTYDEHFCKSS